MEKRAKLSLTDNLIDYDHRVIIVYNQNECKIKNKTKFLLISCGKKVD